MAKEVKYAILIVVLALGSTAALIVHHVHSVRSQFSGDTAAEMVTGLPTLLEFGSPMCGACAQMEPILDALKRDGAGVINVRKLDVQEHGKTAKLYDVEYLPTLFLLDAENQLLWRQVGLIQSGALRAKLREFGIDVKEKR